MAKLIRVRWLLCAFLAGQGGQAVGPSPAVQAAAAVAEAKTSKIKSKKTKRRGGKAKAKQRSLKQRSGAKGTAKDKRLKSRAEAQPAAAKTMAAKKGLGQQEEDTGISIFGLLFIALVLAAAGYGVMVAYRRSHPGMEWDNIRGMEDTGLRQPGQTNPVGLNFSRPKWRLFNKGADSPPSVLGEEPRRSKGEDRF